MIVCLSQRRSFSERNCKEAFAFFQGEFYINEAERIKATL